MDHRDNAAHAFGLLPVPQSKIRFSETLREQNDQRLKSDPYPSATSSRGKIILVLVVALVATIVSAPVSYALWYFHY